VLVLNGIMLHINFVKELVIMNIKIIYMVAAQIFLILEC
jgi:hypothetical protein